MYDSSDIGQYCVSYFKHILFVEFARAKTNKQKKPEKITVAHQSEQTVAQQRVSADETTHGEEPLPVKIKAHA